MLSIEKNDIVLCQVANTKQQAITAVANGLLDKGYVSQGYEKGMQAREMQASTFLGNGIAIPHGTTETRDQVIKTGIILHHFPEGVNWGDGNTVYLAIGIAAQSDEHLSILKMITKALSDDGVEARLKQVENADEIVALLMGTVQTETLFDRSLIELDFPAKNLLAMSAVASGLIKNSHAANSDFVADIVSNKATSLGQGLWLSSSSQGVNKTALSFVRNQTEFSEGGKSVKGLICIASKNQLHVKNLTILIKLLHDEKTSLLFSENEEKIIALLSQEDLSGSKQTFTIRNPHGLHARPGAMLVHTTKKFESKIQMSNLDGTGKPENAKSLMKVMTLGIKFKDRVEFTAEGSDAEEAILAIGEAIKSGLGEQL